MQYGFSRVRDQVPMARFRDLIGPRMHGEEARRDGR